MKDFDEFESENYLRKLVTKGEFSSAAAYLHKLAAMRKAAMPQHPVNCLCAHCRRDGLDRQLRIERLREAAMRREVAV